MNYFNLPCPICGEALEEGGDIVVCPECGAPHHRECWFKNGRCANAELHAEGYAWSPETKQDTREIPISDDAPESESSKNRICHVCGSENPLDALHCGNCGALFGDTAKNGGNKVCCFCGAESSEDAQACEKCGAPFIKFVGDNPYFKTANENPFLHGIDADPNEKIGDFTVAEYASFTQLNARRFIPKFRKIEDGKITFNWAAFFFGANWFLFRKIYKIGILLVVAVVSVSMMTTPIQNKFFGAYEAFAAEAEKYADPETGTIDVESIPSDVQHKMLENCLKSSAAPLAALASIDLLISLFCGFTADRFYYKKVRTDMKAINESNEEPFVRKLMIARRGSVSYFAFFAGSLGSNLLMQLLASLAIFISS